MAGGGDEEGIAGLFCSSWCAVCGAWCASMTLRRRTAETIQVCVGQTASLNGLSLGVFVVNLGFGPTST
jgi:hypothetical protein